MEQVAFFETFWWTWILLPVLIFFSRILDQSIGTLRLIFVSKGFHHIAPVLGFFEVIIWLLAITQVLKHLYNPHAFYTIEEIKAVKEGYFGIHQKKPFFPALGNLFSRRT